MPLPSPGWLSQILQILYNSVSFCIILYNSVKLCINQYNSVKFSIILYHSVISGINNELNGCLFLFCVSRLDCLPFSTGSFLGLTKDTQRKGGGSEPQTKEYLTTSATSDQKLEYRTIWLAPLRYCLTPTTAAPKQKPVQNRSYKQSANTLCRTSRKPASPLSQRPLPEKTATL